MGKAYLAACAIILVLGLRAEAAIVTTNPDIEGTGNVVSISSGKTGVKPISPKPSDKITTIAISRQNFVNSNQTMTIVIEQSKDGITWTPVCQAETKGGTGPGQHPLSALTCGFRYNDPTRQVRAQLILNTEKLSTGVLLISR